MVDQLPKMARLGWSEVVPVNEDWEKLWELRHDQQRRGRIARHQQITDDQMLPFVTIP